jgi:hypothetical protein
MTSIQIRGQVYTFEKKHVKGVLTGLALLGYGGITLGKNYKILPQNTPMSLDANRYLITIGDKYIVANTRRGIFGFLEGLIHVFQLHNVPLKFGDIFVDNQKVTLKISEPVGFPGQFMPVVEIIRPQQKVFPVIQPSATLPKTVVQPINVPPVKTVIQPINVPPVKTVIQPINVSPRNTVQPVTVSPRNTVQPVTVSPRKNEGSVEAEAKRVLQQILAKEEKFPVIYYRISGETSSIPEVREIGELLQERALAYVKQNRKADQLEQILLSEIIRHIHNNPYQGLLNLKVILTAAKHAGIF